MRRFCTSNFSVNSMTSTTMVGRPNGSRACAGKMRTLGKSMGETGGHKVLRRQTRFFRIDSSANDVVNLFRYQKCPVNTKCKYGKFERSLTRAIRKMEARSNSSKLRVVAQKHKYSTYKYRLAILLPIPWHPD